MMKPTATDPEAVESKSGSKPDAKGDMKAQPTAAMRTFAPNVWIADGPNVRDFGVLFTTRMVVVKLADGSLWVDSPVPVAFDTLKHIAELGPVHYLITATPRHVWRPDTWHTLFPDAQLWVPRPTPFTLKKGHLPLSGILGDEPYHDWADELDQLAFKGNPLIEEVLFLHKDSRTVILDDLIQNHQLARRHPLRNALIALEGVAYPHGGVPLDIRLSFTDRNRARRSLEQLLAWDFDKLIIAHGPCVEHDAKPFVARAFRWPGSVCSVMGWQFAQLRPDRLDGAFGQRRCVIAKRL
jgi:hypothetical protein